jgi:signal transduction histidine kinase
MIDEDADQCPGINAPPDAHRKQLSELRHLLDVLAGDSERLQRLVLDLLRREDRRAGYRVEATPGWGDLAAAIRRARRRRQAQAGITS